MNIKLSILPLVLVCTVGLSTCASGTADTTVSVNGDEPPCVLEKSEDMGEEYIDSFVFFGESTTYHLKSRGVLSGGTSTKQVLADKSGTAFLDKTTKNMPVIYPDSGELIPFSEAIGKIKPKYLLLTFGLNGAIGNTERGEEYFSSCYLSLINAVRTASPDTKIILGSCYPVAKNMDMSNYSVSVTELNECIKTLNFWTLSLARREGLRYLNVNEMLTDEDGSLCLEYQVGDGHHLTREAYIEIIEYIRTHGYK